MGDPTGMDAVEDRERLLLDLLWSISTLEDVLKKLKTEAEDMKLHVELDRPHQKLYWPWEFREGVDDPLDNAP